MNSFIEACNWRYATKKYDPLKKVSTEDLNTLKEAIRLCPSSNGLQPYKILIIENPELRGKIKEAAWGKDSLIEASHLFIFANEIDLEESEIDKYIERVSKTREIPTDKLSGYSAVIKSLIAPLSNEAKNNWTAKQTYIAMANLLNAAAMLGIDATPMEGFEPKKVNEILGLDKLKLNATLITTVGYRHKDDITQYNKKVRKKNEELFINL